MRKEYLVTGTLVRQLEACGAEDDTQPALLLVNREVRKRQSKLELSIS